jgi:hypothetical protein
MKKLSKGGFFAALATAGELYRKTRNARNIQPTDKALWDKLAADSAYYQGLADPEPTNVLIVLAVQQAGSDLPATQAEWLRALAVYESAWEAHQRRFEVG